MTWFAVGAAVIGMGTSLYGASQAKKGGRAAKELGNLNAAYITQETTEETRRLKFEQEEVAGRSRAVIAASGFRSGKKSMGASSKAYLQKLKEVQSSELAWLQKSGKSRADIARKGGQVEGKRLKSQAIGLYGQALTSGLKGWEAWDTRND